MDATSAYHEAMNKTLALYFTDKSYEQFVANMDSSKYAFDAVSYIIAEIAKEAIHLKLNVHLMNSSNGAPRLMQQDAKKFVFLFVATSVVGSGFGGVALKIGGKASKASKSYLNKFEHKFAKDNTKTSSGLHNQEWDDVVTPKAGETGAFQTSRKIDMKDLSKADRVARKNIIKQGITKPKEQKMILSSGKDFKTIPYKTGDNFYSFGTSGRSFNNGSVFRLDEAGFKDVQAKYYNNGKWDSAGVKSYLALPCKNRANALFKSKVTENQTAPTSTIGSATENVAYKRHGNLYPGNKTMTGGGYQVIVNTSKMSKGERIW